MKGFVPIAPWDVPSPGDDGRWLAPLSLPEEINRRGFIQASLGCMAGAASVGAFATVPDGSASMSAPQNFWSQPRWVWLRRLGTKEEIKTYYWNDGQLDQQAYQKICWFLRDMRFESLLAQQSPVLTRAVTRGQVAKSQLTPWALMDPIVVDILYAYSSWLAVYGVSRPLEVTSGFRHFLTNSMTEGAARDSWHTKAGAVDFTIPGVSIEQVARFGMWLAGGGVGLYRNKNFTHVDRGRVRSWAK